MSEKSPKILPVWKYLMTYLLFSKAGRSLLLSLTVFIGLAVMAGFLLQKPKNSDDNFKGILLFGVLVLHQLFSFARFLFDRDEARKQRNQQIKSRNQDLFDSIGKGITKLTGAHKSPKG